MQRFRETHGKQFTAGCTSPAYIWFVAISEHELNTASNIVHQGISAHQRNCIFSCEIHSLTNMSSSNGNHFKKKSPARRYVTIISQSYSNVFLSTLKSLAELVSPQSHKGSSRSYPVWYASSDRRWNWVAAKNDFYDHVLSFVAERNWSSEPVNEFASSRRTEQSSYRGSQRRCGRCWLCWRSLQGMPILSLNP